MTNTLPNLGNLGKEDRIVSIDGKDHIIHDGDTAYELNPDGTTNLEKGVRVYGVDAPEVTKMKPGEGFETGVAAEDYTSYLGDFIKSGYNITKKKDEDAYKRDVSDLTTKGGRSFAYDSILGGYNEPGIYTLEDADLDNAWAVHQMDTLVRGSKAIPPEKQGELMYNALTAQFYQPRPIDLPESTYKASMSDAEGDPGFFGQLWDSTQMWYYQTINAYHGNRLIAAELAGDDEAVNKISGRIDKNLERIGKAVDPGTVVSLEDIDNLSDTVNWAANNIVLQGFDYAIIAGSTSTGAYIGSAGGPVGTVVGAGIGSLVGIGYAFLKGTGDYAAEQYEATGEVDPRQALFWGSIIGALDRVGAGRIVKPGEFLTKEGQDKVIKHLMDTKGVSKEVAEQTVMAAVKGELRKIGKEAAINAGDILTKRQIALGTTKRILKEAGQETATELSQEAIQYLSIHGVPETAKEWEEFAWRMGDAAAAGGFVGGVYNAPGALSDRAAVLDLRSAVSTGVDDKRSGYDQFRLDLDQHDDYDNNLDPIDKASKWDFAQEENKVATLGQTEASKYFGLDYIKRGTKRALQLKSIPGASALRNMFGDIRYDNDGKVNPEIGIMEDIIEAHSIEKASRIGQAITAAPWLNNPSARLPISDSRFRTLLNVASDNDFDIGLMARQERMTDEEINIMKDIREDLRKLNAQLYIAKKEAAERRGSKLGSAEVEDWKKPTFLLGRGLPDFDKIRTGKSAFVSELTGAKVRGDTNGIHAGRTIREKDAEAMVVKALAGDAKELLEVLDATDIPALANYYDNDAFNRLTNRVTTEVQNQANLDYFGPNFRIMDNLARSLVNRGAIDKKRAKDLYADIWDQVSVTAGTFGKLPKWLSSLQAGAMMTTTLGQLDWVIFSQISEVPFSKIGVTKDDNDKFLTDIGKSAYLFSSNYIKTLDDVVSKTGAGKQSAARKYVQDTADELGGKHLLKTSVQPDVSFEGLRNDYEALGYTAEDVAAQNAANLQSMPKYVRNVNTIFAGLIGLVPFTDSIRMDRMIGWFPTMMDLTQSLVDIDVNDINSMNGLQLRDYQRLRHYGFTPEDIQFFSSSLDGDPLTVEKQMQDPAFVQKFNAIFDKSAPRFVDEMVVRIKPGSRPRFLEDERFAIPTQYLSFSFHFMNNQLPRLYSTYGYYGSQRMAWSTFRAIGMALFLAATSQWMKDYIKHGKLNPALAENGELWRALDYSSTLGILPDMYTRLTGSDYYEYADKGLWGDIIGPTGSHLSKLIGGTARELSQGDYEGAIHNLIKTQVPFGDLRKEKEEE